MNRSTQSLILNIVFPSLFVGLLVGAGLGYTMGKSSITPISAKIEGNQQEQRSLAKTSPNLAAEAATVSEKPFSTANTTTAPRTSILGPEGSPSPYATPDPESVRQLGQKSWTQGTVQSKEVDENTGEISTDELLPDGSKASRVYRADGSLKDEEVQKPDGSTLNRNFFENGNVKIGYVRDTDGSATSVLYDSTGVITQQSTEYPDHTRIYNEYDDHGVVTSTWRIFPDGHTEPYPPHASE